MAGNASGNIDFNRFQLLRAKVEQVTSLPSFDGSAEPAGDLSRLIFVDDTGSPDFGLWLGGDGAWTRVSGANLGVQTLAALRALTSADREDKQVRLVEDVGLTYRFDEQSTIDPSSDPDVEIPDDVTHPDPGRWILIELNEANEISFDPTTSSLIATNVQAVIEELNDTKINREQAYGGYI